MVERKKILYVITKSNFGGAQRYVYTLATSLPKDTYNVSVAFGEGGLLEAKLTAAGIRTIRIEGLQRNVNPLLDIKTLRALIRLFKTEQPDIVHLNSSKIGGLGGLAARIAHVPTIVFTGHGWAFNEERSFFSKILIGMVHWITILLSHATIAVSDRTKEQVRRLPLISSKIVTVHNGLESIQYMDRIDARTALVETNPTLSATHTTHPDKIWIGTLSELHKNKGLDVAIEAMAGVTKKHPAAIFIVAGEGEERSALQQKITDLNLQHNVLLLGFIENAARYLKAFDIFTLTSRTEAFPYSILEAGAAGLPIVASCVGGIPEIITDMENGILVKPRNAKELEEALLYLLDHKEKMELFGAAIRQKVEQKFTIDAMVHATEAIYTTTNPPPRSS